MMYYYINGVVEERRRGSWR